MVRDVLRFQRRVHEVRRYSEVVKRNLVAVGEKREHHDVVHDRREALQEGLFGERELREEGEPGDVDGCERAGVAWG